ncbi:UbiA family prenyltransferase [Qipengyuania zhejiangensis]|uniref:UbiA family prenyltransferase n=1 Tax=Qipengyuania zhejiangensis TaxID=3077782 RepID=UPI002D7A3D9B|nr:UbiA family prenyltransferase [Qipengyuania sp. Z2]
MDIATTKGGHTGSNAGARDIVVDLDGTLSRVDALHEDFFAGLKNSSPSKLVRAIFGSGGKAAMKRSLARLAGRNSGLSPLRPELVGHLDRLRVSGCSLHLVTASDQYHADAIGEATGLFDTVTGSDGQRNLKGPEKASYLTEQFPEGFIYAGDSTADIPVWLASSGAILVGRGKRQGAKLESKGVPIVETFDDDGGRLRDWFKMFRLHQWIKNTLIFVPLLLGQLFMVPEAVIATALGMLFWSIAGSGTYIVNDIFDIEADRSHRTKCNRPLASGRIGVAPASVVAIGLIAIGLVGGFWLSTAFGIALSWYLVTTLAYSFGLKAVPLLDVGIIALLFTSRIVAGSLLLALPHSPWLTSFSVFVFFSLALAKRHVELVTTDVADDEKTIAGRGYRVSDWPLTLAFGLSAAMASCVVMLLFITLEAAARGVYARPEMLYITPIVLLFWFMRIWLLAHRGELNDDPVIFAVKDPVSIGLGAALLAGFAASVASSHI